MADGFPTLMRKLDAGDAVASNVIFEQYACRLIGLTRQHLNDRVKGKVDQDDVVQSVFRTFFRRAREGEFQLSSEDALWALLAEIAVRKCGKWNRHFHTRKRNAAREASPEVDSDIGSSREPGPEEAATLADLVETLLRHLDDRQRTICEMRLQGYPVAEIAVKSGCAQATVFRELNVIQEQLEMLIPGQAV